MKNVVFKINTSAVSLCSDDPYCLKSCPPQGSPLPLTEVAWRYYDGGWHSDPALRAIGEATPESRAAQLKLGLSIGEFRGLNKGRKYCVPIVKDRDFNES